MLNKFGDIFYVFVGPSSLYGVLGICSSLKSQARTCVGFDKSHLSCLVLLNLQALAAKSIKYHPWAVHADYQLNMDADVNGLWVCRYNR